MDAGASWGPISILERPNADGILFLQDMVMSISSPWYELLIALATRDHSRVSGRMRAWTANGGLRMPLLWYGVLISLRRLCDGQVDWKANSLLLARWPEAFSSSVGLFILTEHCWMLPPLKKIKTPGAVMPGCAGAGAHGEPLRPDGRAAPSSGAEPPGYAAVIPT